MNIVREAWRPMVSSLHLNRLHSHKQPKCIAKSIKEPKCELANNIVRLVLIEKKVGRGYKEFLKTKQCTEKKNEACTK